MTSHYEFDIARATRAADLHALSVDIRENETVAVDEVDELLKLVAQKFGAMNQAAAGKQKSRW